MRFIIRSTRWEFDLDVGRREPAKPDDDDHSPTNVSGDSIYADRADTDIGFTLPSTRYYE